MRGSQWWTLGVSVKPRDFHGKTRCCLSSAFVITVIAPALEFITEDCQSHLNMYGIALTTNYTTVCSVYVFLAFYVVKWGEI